MPRSRQPFTWSVGGKPDSCAALKKAWNGGFAGGTRFQHAEDLAAGMGNPAAAHVRLRIRLVAPVVEGGSPLGKVRAAGI